MNAQLSHEEAQEMRWQRLVSTVRLAPFGSLWLVPEPLWQELLPKYDANSRRKYHPGCVVSSRRSTGYLEPIPMLYGTSIKRSGSVVVCDILGSPHKTYFGVFPPVPVSQSQWRRKPRITPTTKGCVNPDEEVNLQKLCVKRGWL